MFKIDGSDKKYPNLKESTGYPDDILGLGGVNCRHRMFPFFPGISTPNPIRFNEEENRRVYELTQKQRAMECRMRQLKKEQAAAKEIGDNETVKKLNKEISEQSTKIDDFCKKNNLRRDHSRELVKEQIMPKKSVAKSENSGIIKEDEIIGRSVGAAGRNYPVRLPNGNHAKFAEGTTITKIKVFAGKGTDIPIREAIYLKNDFGIPAEDWQKIRGEGIIVFKGKKQTGRNTLV